MELELDNGGKPFGLLATHLGLGQRERSAQIERLTGIVSARDSIHLLLGDLNVWSGQSLRPLVASGFVFKAVPSFPTWPGALVALDRILVRKPVIIHRCFRYESLLARVASDHFPLVAELAFEM